MRGGALWRLAIAGVGLHHQQADRREREGPAGREQAEVADVHEAVRQDMLEETADELHA